MNLMITYMRQSPRATIADTNLIGVELLITDAKVAQTFLDMAETTSIAEDRARRIREAEQAYRSILKFLQRLSPTVEQSEVLSKEIKVLEARLRAAGVAIP